MKIKTCSHCGGYNHTSVMCFSKPKSPPRAKRRIRKIGKVGRQWYAVRREWIKKNLPDDGYWRCTYCGNLLYLNTLTLDHKQSRSRRPDLRYELDNLVPSCWEDNSAKGSMSYEEYLEKIQEAKYA